MKNFKNLFALCALFVAAMFIFSCGETAENAKDAVKDAAEKTTEVAKDAANTAADAVVDAAEDAVDAVKGESGPEYTSKYVCPMHCKGSGSDKEGKCPECGMAYVMNEKTKATDHEDHSGHNH